MKKLFLFLSIFCTGIFCDAEEFSMEKYGDAMKEMRQGGLPVVAVYVRNIEYLPPVKKHLLENKAFMAQDGKKFRFFCVDMVRMASFPIYDRVVVYHKDNTRTNIFELAEIKPENYAEKIENMLKPIPDEIKFSYYPHGDIKKFYQKVKKGEFSYHVTDCDGTHIFHYHLEHYFRGLFIPDEIMIDMIRELRKKNHPKEFWSKALMLHTYNCSAYYRPGTGERSIGSWLKIADLLLEAGADPNYADDYGLSTAYMLLRVASGKWDKAGETEPVFLKLAGAGLDINRIYPNKRYPEQGFAIRRNNGNYIEDPIPEKGEHPWLLNYKFSWNDKIYLIKKWKLDINAGGGYFLKDVIANFRARYSRVGRTQYELVEELLKLGANPNARVDAEAQTPFLLVCQNLHRNGMLEIFHLMLQHGADPNLTWVYVDRHFDRHTRNAYTTIPHYKLDTLREYVDALLDKGLKPESIDIGAAMGKRDEDLAIYILEKGGYCKTFDSIDKRRFPRLAEHVKKLPPSRIKPDPPDKGSWQRDYAVMRPQGTPQEKAVLQRAADILLKYTDFRSNQRFYFSSSYSLDMVFYPGCPAPNYRDWIVDESFFVDSVYAKTEEEKEISYIRTALAMSDWSLELLFGIVYGFPKGTSRGRDIDLIELKEKAIYGLKVNLQTASELYVFLPKHNQIVLDYLPEHTAAFLKKQLDAIPKDAQKKDKDKDIQKTVGELLTFYWRGEAPDEHEGLQEEISAYWGKLYAVMEEELVRLSKLELKPLARPERFMKSSIVRILVSPEVVRNRAYNRTHRKPQYDSFEEKIRIFKESFTGSKAAKRNFARIIDLMLTVPTARRLLETMPDDLRFYSGTYGNMEARYSYHKQVGIYGVKIDAADDVSGTPEYKLSLINDLVHEMTHCEQQVAGVKPFYAADNRENMVYHKLQEIHPQINSYLALRDFLDHQDYKDTADKMLPAYCYVLNRIFNQHSGDLTLWRNEVVKAYMTNGRIYPVNDSRRGSIQKWFFLYRKQFRYPLRNKDGLRFEELIEKYEQLMGTDLGLDFYQNVDPVSQH